MREEACTPAWALERSWLEVQILIRKSLGCSCVHWEGALGSDDQTPISHEAEALLDKRMRGSVLHWPKEQRR